MKVVMGPYKNWIGPYQVAEWFENVGLSEETCDRFGEWLSKRTYFCKFLDFIARRRHRNISVKIHDYDTWGMYETLSVIIAPMLRQLKETKHGYPLVDNKDVPVELRVKRPKNYYTRPTTDGDNTIEEKEIAKWDWVIGEMIFAFEQYEARVMVDYDWEDQFTSGEIDMQMKEVELDGKTFHTLEKGPNHTYEIDTEGMKAYTERIRNGFILFGKYYLSLWD